MLSFLFIFLFFQIEFLSDAPVPLYSPMLLWRNPQAKVFFFHFRLFIGIDLENFILFLFCPHSSHNTYS